MARAGTVRAEVEVLVAGPDGGGAPAGLRPVVILTQVILTQATLTPTVVITAVASGGGGRERPPVLGQARLFRGDHQRAGVAR